jgi:hypothetical protein
MAIVLPMFPVMHFIAPWLYRCQWVSSAQQHSALYRQV